MRTRLTTLAAAAVAVAATGLVAAPAHAGTPPYCTWKSAVTVHCGKAPTAGTGYRAVVVCNALKAGNHTYLGPQRIAGERGSSTRACPTGETFVKHGVRLSAVHG